MESHIKLFDMDKKDMRHLTKCSTIMLLVSLVISAASVTLLHVFSDRQSNTKQPPVPSAFIIAEIAIMAIVALLTLNALQFHLTRQQPAMSLQKHFNRILLLLLICSLTFSLPFRSLAEIMRGANGIPSSAFIMCRDVATAVGSGLLFIFLWSYPSIWEGSSDVTVRPYIACVCFLYTALRIGISFSFRIHFDSLPLQHLFSIAGIFAHEKSTEISWVQVSLILLLSTIECVLILCVYCNYTACSNNLFKSSDPSKQQNIIALWYCGRALTLLCVSIIAAAVARLLSPASQTAKLVKQSGIILLSSPIGGSAIALAILSYALRETYVHSLAEDDAMSFAMSFVTGSRFRKWDERVVKELENDLLYRIADERDPQNEDPIPQPNTFSFESAMLLFNSAWLSTTYAARGMKPLTPSDFGRPMCAVRAVVSDANNSVVAIILERMDRLIIAFKPVFHSLDRKDDLRYMHKTDFGKSLSQSFEDQEVLPVKDINDLFGKSLRTCQLHHGYSKAYASIQSELHTHIRDLTMDTSRPLYLTGFGSGGAIATLCALDICMRKISDTNTVSLYTYGSPRAMNLEMTSVFERVVSCRWRCVVAGDCNTVRPTRNSYRHFSKVATFTRSGHLALECDRVYKWWQSEVSAYPMHKISAYYCAFAKWHKSYHVKGSIDLWNWQVDKTVSALFYQDAPADIMHTADFMLESPITDVEAKSLRTLGKSPAWQASPQDDVVAFKR